MLGTGNWHRIGTGAPVSLFPARSQCRLDSIRRGAVVLLEQVAVNPQRHVRIGVA